MSWQCTSWALREAPAPTSTARLVLIALADRCQPDGRSAWPTIETLAEEAHTSKASVKRALKALEECGAIRRGNQLLAQWDEHGQYVPEPYRPIVWECCMDVTLEHIVEKPGKQARAEREQRLGTTAKNRGVKMTPLENVGNKPIPSGVKMTPLNDEASDRGVTSDTSRGSTSDTSIRRTNKKQIFPSAPTGHLPASGATQIEEGISQTGEMPTASDVLYADPRFDAGADGLVEWVESSDEFDALDAAAVDADAVAGRVLASLESLRRHEGLTTRPATVADRQAVAALARRLSGDGVPSPESLMLDVLAYATLHDWHAKHVDSGRRFARTFDSLRNNMAVDDRSAGRRRPRDGKSTDVRSQSPAAPQSRPTPVPPDHRPRTVDPARSERNRRDLAAYAAAHGGSCFAGNWTREAQEVGS